MVDQGKIALIDFWWVLGLSAAAIGIITAWDKFKEWRNKPIQLTSKPTGKMITIAIPEFVIPRSEGESTESIKDKYRPKVTIDGNEWVVTVPAINYEQNGMVLNYIPPPIRVPLVPSMDVVTLALKLAPIVLPVTEPPGWRVQFPVITLEA